MFRKFSYCLKPRVLANTMKQNLFDTNLNVLNYEAISLNADMSVE